MGYSGRGMVDTDAGVRVRNNPALSELPNHISTAPVLYSNTSADQGWQITNTEIHLRDKPLLFLCISVLESAESLKTHRLINYSRNNSVFLVMTAFFYLAGKPSQNTSGFAQKGQK